MTIKNKKNIEYHESLKHDALVGILFGHEVDAAPRGPHADERIPGLEHFLQARRQL